MKTAPLLSIGMIFKNEERCLERCLKSLQPLREAIPCELVMADTGSTDGSRAIAEKYADEVFDFAWVDDFAAARNAVVDRCSGKWHLTVDSDEWLDEDILELVAFLKKNERVDLAFVVVRNYTSPTLEEGAFNDFRALRLMRVSPQNRFIGAIHEVPPYHEPAERLLHTVLHHDGYCLADAKARKEKLRRNMKLLRQKLQEEPEDLRTLLQCIESGRVDADYIQYVRTAIQLIQSGKGRKMGFGPIILAHAVEFARAREMPELADWIQLAKQRFPESVFTMVDVNFTAFMAAYDTSKWEEAVRYGEAYRKGLCAYRSAPPSSPLQQELVVGCLDKENAKAEGKVLIGLANAYLQAGQGKKALHLLEELEGEKTDPAQVRNIVVALSQLHAQTALEIAPALRTFYEQLRQERPDEKKRLARLAAFDEIAAAAFTQAYREEEQTHEGYCRPAYTLFAALADVCEVGRAAKIMMSADPAEMRQWLLKVEDWQALPIEALEHALKAGVEFPLPEKPLDSEIMSGLAARLTHDANLARQLALALAEDAEFESLQSLCWAQALGLGAMRSFDWTLGKNDKPASRFACPAKPKKEGEHSQRPADTPETGLALIRRFAALEAAALPLMYTPQMLTEQNAALLPPMHRWGLYCAQALAALDAGQPQEYLALLRKGLAACPGQKNMVQFLLDRFLEDAQPHTSPELLALAERIRAILAAYSPDDPAVAAIRESPAYKQVAWIIEEVPGLPAQ